MAFIVTITLIFCISILPSTRCQVYPLEGQPETGYSLSVRLGTPPQEFKVLLDSGSSNFAVAAENFPSIHGYPYFDKALSQSFRDINREVGVRYIEGEWSGRVGKDNFSFATDSESEAQNTIVYVSLMETVSSGFFKTSTGWVGVLGMGYAGLSMPDASVLPVMDSLVAHGVTADKFGLQLCEPDAGMDGELIEMGGKMSLGSGAPLLPSNEDVFTYAAITEKSFYKLILTDIKVGSTSLDLPCSVFNQEFSIIDSGTTELLFNAQTFSALIAKLKHSAELFGSMEIPDSFWEGESALGWKRGSHEEFKSFENLEISLQLPDSREEALSIVVPPQLYLKRVSSEGIDIKAGDYCSTTNCSWYKLGIKQNPVESASGSILGMMLFKGYTVEFDRGGARVGFGPSACKIHGIDNPNQVLKVSKTVRAKVEDCAYSTPSNLTIFQVFLCVFFGCVVLGMLALVLIGAGCLLKTHCSPPSKVPTSRTRDLESMLLRTSSSDSEAVTESDEDLLN